jgi:hypothetical protein
MTMKVLCISKWAKAPGPEERAVLQPKGIKRAAARGDYAEQLACFPKRVPHGIMQRRVSEKQDRIATVRRRSQLFVDGFRRAFKKR